MTIYMVHTYTLVTGQTPLGEQRRKEPLGNVIFEDRVEAEFHAAECRELGLVALVQPRVVIRREPELAVAS